MKTILKIEITRQFTLKPISCAQKYTKCVCFYSQLCSNQVTVSHRRKGKKPWAKQSSGNNNKKFMHFVLNCCCCSFGISLSMACLFTKNMEFCHVAQHRDVRSRECLFWNNNKCKLYKLLIIASCESVQILEIFRWQLKFWCIQLIRSFISMDAYTINWRIIEFWNIR